MPLSIVMCTFVPAGCIIKSIEERAKNDVRLTSKVLNNNFWEDQKVPVKPAIIHFSIILPSSNAKANVCHPV